MTELMTDEQLDQMIANLEKCVVKAKLNISVTGRCMVDTDAEWFEDCLYLANEVKEHRAKKRQTRYFNPCPERLTYDIDGNVGVGTPTERLQVGTRERENEIICDKRCSPGLTCPEHLLHIERETDDLA